MISKKELQEYAQVKKLNLGQAEKDYFQQIFLSILYSSFGKELVFKGGTALNKAYGLDRFSEDLDFTLSQEAGIKEVLQEGIKRFYLEVEIEEKKFVTSFSFALRIIGPLYNGVRQSLCKLEFDFSLRENVIREPMIISLGRLLRELPSFDVVVMAKEEILAEKIRAIMTRTKARDVYDLWFLLQENTAVDSYLIQKKLEYCQKNYDFAEFKKQLNAISEIWVPELTPLVTKVPSFTLVKKGIMDKMKEIKQ